MIRYSLTGFRFIYIWDSDLLNKSLSDAGNKNVQIEFCLGCGERLFPCEFKPIDFPEDRLTWAVHKCPKITSGRKKKK